MKVRFASEQEIKNWDKHIVANPDGGNIFASYEFAMQKKLGGYKPRFVFVDDVALTILEKQPLLGIKLWYLPKGPGVNGTKALFSALTALKTFAKHRGVFAIRIEPEFDRSSQSILARHGLVKTEPIIPNPSTITLDIAPKLDKVLETLPQKGRYAIKRAEREGVEVKQVRATEANCKVMYKLLSETAQGRFGIRNYHYFYTFWQRFEKAGLGQMFFAYFDGKVVAGAYAMTMGKKSTYKDGASSREHPVYGASHLLQWHVIDWAKSRGSLVHDLCGSPPSEHIANSKHPHYGIGLFKTAFSRNITDYVGCYDLVINPVIYSFWSLLGEKIAKRIHYWRHRDQYY